MAKNFNDYYTQEAVLLAQPPDDLRQRFSELGSHERLLKKEFGQAGSLERFEDEIREIYQAAARLYGLPWSDYSRFTQAHLALAVDRFADVAERIRAYDPQATGQGHKSPEPFWKSVRTKEAKLFWEAVKEAEAARLLHSAETSDQDRGLIAETRGLLDDQLEANSERVAKIEKQAAAALEAARAASASSGVSAYRDSFDDAAQEHKESSKTWLKAAGAAAVGVLIALALGLWWFGDGTGTANAIRDSLSRLLLIALPALAMSVSLRNYSAARHNAIVYETKANALSTFEAFVEAAESDSTIRETITLEAARSVFSHQPSGHLRSGNDADPSSSMLLEVFRSNRPSSGG